jgi:phosphoribosylaminoimidazole-succinocarboxamide synthase
VCGIGLPDGLEQASKLPKTLFTPSTKAAVGDHDENIPFDEVVKFIGKDMATQVKNAAIKLFEAASSYADERGIIIADTKFEFGTDENGVLHIMDEALTPDSSRFWEKEAYQVGTSPKSFDKQIIRDYLSTLNWDKQNPGPVLPDEVINGTLAKYQEVIDRLQQT